MNQHILFSMCNQSRHGRGRTHCLGLLNPARSNFRWIRSGTTRRDFGITGLSCDEQGYYAAVQAHNNAIRIIRYLPDSFKILSVYFLKYTGDPHSLCIHKGELLIASTSNNAIYCLRRKNGDITSEELFWRYPDTSKTENDVHLNCLADHKGELYATLFGPRGGDGKFGAAGELVNVTTGETCLSHLHQPHTILFTDGHVYCASSASSEIVRATHTNTGWVEMRSKLRGYTRGLSVWNEGIIAGISAHRTHSRSKGSNVSRPDNFFEKSQLVLLKKDLTEEKVVLDTSNLGLEIYEILTMEPPVRRPRSPLFSSRLESLRASVMHKG